MPAPSFGNGHIAVVQSDSRMCELPVSATAPVSYWWMTAQINSRWAELHGYDHVTYCHKLCVRASSVTLSPAWCKLLALQDALRWDRWDTEAQWGLCGGAADGHIIDPVIMDGRV